MLNLNLWSSLSRGKKMKSKKYKDELIPWLWDWPRTWKARTGTNHIIAANVNICYYTVTRSLSVLLFSTLLDHSLYMPMTLLIYAYEEVMI